MLIFNCTRAFAKFIEPDGRPDSQPLVSPPLAETMRDEVSLLRQEHGAFAQNVLRWQCHLIEVQGRDCVIAMEADARFAMVFTTLERGRPTLFVDALIGRLFQLQWAIAEALELVSDAERDAWGRNFIDAHLKSCFIARTDKSVQTHINEVACDFSWEVGVGDRAFPETDQACASFDLLFNDRLRSTRDRREYFCPHEAMLFHWLDVYGGWTPDGLAKVRAAIQRRSRQSGFRMRELRMDSAR